LTFVTRPAGQNFTTLANALAVYHWRFRCPQARARPTIIALSLCGLLPVIENAVTWLERVPHGVREGAEGLGLSACQGRDRQAAINRASNPAGMRVLATIRPALRFQGSWRRFFVGQTHPSVA